MNFPDTPEGRPTMRSCCKQLKEFVDFGKNFHKEIGHFYRQLNKQTELERVKMLLDYLSRHEQHLEESLARFKKENHPKILEAWLEYSPELNVEKHIQAAEIHAGMTTDEVVDIAMRFDDTLIKLYEELAEKANDPHVKELLTNLLELEKTEKIQTMRAAMSLQDM